ncbi:MAG: nitrate reductase associated protein [Candidatus Binatia bacterium]
MRDAREREADRLAEERLELLPRAVRDKLDRVGFKVHLAEWRAMPLAAREQLRDLPCETANEVARYGQVVERLVRGVTGKPPDGIRRD